MPCGKKQMMSGIPGVRGPRCCLRMWLYCQGQGVMNSQAVQGNKVCIDTQGRPSQQGINHNYNDKSQAFQLIVPARYLLGVPKP